MSSINWSRPFPEVCGVRGVGLYFGVVGDVHGRFELMVKALRKKEEEMDVRFSFILQVGDIECHRTETDLQTMAAPSVHRVMGDFHRFYSGELTLPWPVLFIGGNHECYGWLEEAENGDHLLPNFYYVGRRAAIVIGGIRIACLSGIYREETYCSGRPPSHLFPYKSNRDWIGFSERDVCDLLSLGGVARPQNDPHCIDILITHDWPARLTSSREVMGDKANTNREFGNEPCRLLLERLKPRLHLCGHMHVPFRAVVTHSDQTQTQVCCLSKVPSEGSVSLFHLQSLQLANRIIREMKETPPIPTNDEKTVNEE
jgi:lariat debranching enzyme